LTNVLKVIFFPRKEIKKEENFEMPNLKFFISEHFGQRKTAKKVSKFSFSSSFFLKRYHDTQHNDTQYNDTQDNNIQQNDTA
jgi:hypothetical protein